jgi:hypothetical protein
MPGVKTLDLAETPPVRDEDTGVGIAEEPGTTVLTVGAQPGRNFTPSSWESALLEGSGC